MATNLFCAHGGHRGPCTTLPQDPLKVDVKLVEPPDEHWRDRLWCQEIVHVYPFIVICTISDLSAWMVPEGRVLSHARFFPAQGGAYLHQQQSPPDQRNFLVGLESVPYAFSGVSWESPIPMPDEERQYLVLDGWLDRWGSTQLLWRATEEEALQELHRLSGLTSGCVLRCVFKFTDEDTARMPLCAAWLYATGRPNRMRWSIHPWPAKLPPPHVGV